MYANCASSCHACDSTTRCVWDGADTTLGVPAGSLHTFIERASSDEFRARPEVLSEDPLVLQLDGFLAADEVAALVELSRGLPWSQSQVLQKRMAGAGADAAYRKSAHRDSQNTFCDAQCYESVPARTLLDRARELTLLPPEHTEMQFVRYDPGQYYRTHHDYLGGSDAYLAGPRTLTLFVYLTDVAAGGETAFPALNLTVVPRAGRALLWTSTLDDEPLVKDVRTKHAALPVGEGGHKLAVNVWYYHRDFWKARNLGCVGG